MKPFFSWNFGNCLKQFFLQIKTQSPINLPKIEKHVHFLVPCGSHTVNFFIHDWFVHWTKNTKGKECGSILSSHLWGGALSVDTKNSCVAD